VAEPVTGWRIEVTLDGLVPDGLLSEIIRELDVHAFVDGHRNRCSIIRWVNEPSPRGWIEITVASVGLFLPAGRQIVRVLAESEAEYAERVARLYDMAGPADPAVTRHVVSRRDGAAVAEWIAGPEPG
jgi:hypothetical protein